MGGLIELDFVITTGVVAVLFLFFILFISAKYLKRCPSNKILVIQGRVGKGRSAHCIHGGMKVVWPLIQEYDYLDLTPIAINIPLKGALSRQNIRVNVPSTFTIAISTEPDTMHNAAVRLLGRSIPEIESMATEIIFGQLRLTIASLTIEQINQDREQFLEAIQNNIGPELRKIGLTLINVNITDITDESDYIESIGQKAAATAINQAKIDVAEQQKLGDIGQADAQRERRIKVAEYEADAVKGENESAARIADHNATLAEKKAEAHKRGEVASQKAEGDIQQARALAQTRRLEADEIVEREISKRKIEIDAAAEAEKMRLESQGKADAILAVRTAEAKGIREILSAKAEGYKGIVDACNENPRDAATMLIVEKLETIVELQTEVVKNLKIDKITVWDSGNGEKGSSTANFLSSFMKSLPPLHDVAKMAGVDLPEFLGQVSENGGDAHAHHPARISDGNGQRRSEGGGSSTAS